MKYRFFSYRVNDAEHVELEQIAEEQKRPVGQLVRIVLSQYIQDYKKAKEAEAKQ